MSKLTNDELKHLVKGAFKAYFLLWQKSKRTINIVRAERQLLTLINSQEKPISKEDEEIMKELEYLPEESKKTCFDQLKEVRKIEKKICEDLKKPVQHQQPKDGDVEFAIGWIPDIEKALQEIDPDNGDHKLLIPILRKALIHYGNMPKKAYRYNERLTNKETT